MSEESFAVPIEFPKGLRLVLKKLLADVIILVVHKYFLTEDENIRARATLKIRTKKNC